jgi:hypothetical protein
MVMQERARRLNEPLHWGRREKTVMAAVIACLAVAILGLGAYALTTGSRARAGCITVSFASTLGGAELHACGSRARSVCASGEFSNLEKELRLACQRARLPFRSAA